MNATTDLAFLPDELRGASQCRLVVTFYDQALANLEEAIDAIAAGDIERRYNAVEIATGLIAELALSLDENVGGEIARNLGRLYSFVLGLLPRINTHNDPVPAQHAQKLLRPLRDAWAELDDRIAAGTITGIGDAPAFAGQGDTAGAALMTA